MSEISGRLSNRVAIVTGASSGIGRGVAIAFARERAKVVIAGRSEEKLQAVAAEIRAENGEVSIYAGDLSKERANMELVQVALDTYGSVDVISINAGVFVSSTLEEVTEEMIDVVFGVNFKAVVFALKYALPALRATVDGRGAVVVTTSAMSSAVSVKLSESFLYSASKAAAKMLVQYAAIQAAGDVRVNAIAPGLIRTPMHDAVGDNGLDELASETALIPRGGQVDEVVPTIVHLVSDDSRFTTGAEFVVDGGWSLHT